MPHSPFRVVCEIVNVDVATVVKCVQEDAARRVVRTAVPLCQDSPNRNETEYVSTKCFETCDGEVFGAMQTQLVSGSEQQTVVVLIRPT